VILRPPKIIHRFILPSWLTILCYNPFPHWSGQDSNLSNWFLYLHPMFSPRLINHPGDGRVRTTETSVCFNETTRCCIPKRLLSSPWHFKTVIRYSNILNSSWQLGDSPPTRSSHRSPRGCYPQCEKPCKIWCHGPKWICTLEVFQASRKNKLISRTVKNKTTFIFIFCLFLSFAVLWAVDCGAVL
jgi:hypothetical protein